MRIDFFRFDDVLVTGDKRYASDCTALDAPGCVAPPCGQKPTALSRLAWHANHGTLGRIQLPFPGLKVCLPASTALFLPRTI